MSKLIIKGHSISGGVAEGEAMVTNDPLGGGSIDPKTGRVTDHLHEWRGQDFRGKVLVFPYGKGSTGSGYNFCRAAILGNAPAAVINLETDTACAGAFILAEVLFGKTIPVIERPERNPFEIIKTGDRVKVDGNNGTIEVYC